MRKDPRFQLRCFSILVLGVLSVVVPESAFSYEAFPEFTTLDESEQSAFEGPERLSSEYQSDILTFTKPLIWEYRWLSNNRAYDFTVGSTGPIHFALAHRLKVHQKVLDALEFRFTFFEEGDREKDRWHYLVEFIVWPWRRMGFGAYSEFKMLKRNDDLGFGLYFRPLENSEVKAFFTMVDFSRNGRNDRTDYFQRKPYAFGLVGRWFGSDSQIGNLIEAAFRFETPTEWIFPDTQSEYRFRRLHTSMMSRWQFHPWFGLEGRFQWDEKKELSQPLPGGTSIRTDWTTTRLFLNLDSLWPKVIPWNQTVLVVGVQYAYRYWLRSEGDEQFHDVLPHWWLRFRGPLDGEMVDTFHAGYEMTWHRQGVQTSTDTIEHRMNLLYELNFKENAKLILALTFDLDDFGSTETWEGGNGQFQITF